MYIWNYKKLTQELKNNTITEKESFKYIIGLTITASILISIIEYGPTRELTPINVLSSFTFIVLIIIGMAILFQANQKGDNKDFIKRYTCLSLPTFIQANVWLIITSFAIGIIIGISAGQEGMNFFTKHEIYFNTALTLIFMLILPYYWMYQSIKEISQK